MDFNEWWNRCGAEEWGTKKGAELAWNAALKSGTQPNSEVEMFLTTMYCNYCEKKTERSSIGGCRICAERKYREKVAAWNALTANERLSDLRKRIEKLEAGLPRF